MTHDCSLHRCHNYAYLYCAHMCHILMDGRSLSTVKTPVYSSESPHTTYYPTHFWNISQGPPKTLVGQHTHTLSSALICTCACMYTHVHTSTKDFPVTMCKVSVPMYMLNTVTCNVCSTINLLTLD